MYNSKVYPYLFGITVLIGIIILGAAKAVWEAIHLAKDFLTTRKVKPIYKYFPDIPTALYFIEKGKKKYAKHHRYTMIQKQGIARGTFIDANGNITHYIDPALAAIMVATGREPKLYDLNTPAESYGWDFNETRDLLNALDGLSKGDPHYWNLFYGAASDVRVVNHNGSVVLLNEYKDNPLYHQ